MNDASSIFSMKTGFLVRMEELSHRVVGFCRFSSGKVVHPKVYIKTVNIVATRRTVSKDSNLSDGGVIPVRSVDDEEFTARLSISDFTLLKVLGKGSFGKVMLVTKKDDESKTLFAMKTLRKADLIKRNQVAHTSTERFILESVSSPFLVHLQYAFQSQEKLYMVLDYMGGGELFYWLQKAGSFNESRVKLYVAEVICGLEALHNADIVYRDLKAENLLLDMDGHLRLTDFGLAKAGITGSGETGGTRTFCGSNEYLAPEIILKKGHGKAVDWWTLGVLMYEMLYGMSPFHSKDRKVLYHKILNDALSFPPSPRKRVSSAAKELIKALLTRPIKQRLGTKGSAEVKQSSWLAIVDFELVLTRMYEPEFRPPSAALEEASNFDPMFTNESPVDSPVESLLAETHGEPTNFNNFTYRRKVTLA